MKENRICFGIAVIIGMTSLGVIVLIGIFSPEHMSIAPWTVGALSLMGLGLGYLSSRCDVE